MSQESSEFEIEGTEQHHIKLRQLTMDDYADVKRIMDRVYADIGGAWTEEEMLAQVEAFPDGQICIEDDGKVVAAALAIIVDYDRFTRHHTYDEVTSRSSFSSHRDHGDALYGIDIFVDPDYRDMRLGRRLYDARKALCRSLNLRAMLAGGRIPRYDEASGQLSPHEYIRKVRDHEIRDPILSFQLANDLQVKRVLRGYLPEDEKSGGYATLLEWTNIYYEEKTPDLMETERTKVRVGTVQWQMRTTKSLEQLLQQVEFFVSAVADYNSDFVVFPEFFGTPLMGQFSDDTPTEAVRELAGLTPAIHEEMLRLAMAYNVNIVAGSMPMLEDGKLYNVAWLCRRDGTSDSQAKLHITPDERKYWALQGGNQLHCFDTDVGKVGILICYDVEFPELPRLLTEQGMQILFVPFWTDTKNAYLRVRRCAQARAIENECYVVISGSVGNLPRVANADIQYAQSAVFSPSDFAFPHDAIMAETTPNTEMFLITDLDLDRLKHLRNEGSVRNTMDRRTDLYEVRWVGDE
jgi:predicted amidohydrolase/GNAT superfamily N-acetyltransferase